MTFRRDLKDAAKEATVLGTGVSVYTIIVGIVCVVLVVSAIWVFNLVVLNPYQQRGYNGQVQGLITEFCTAPREADQQAAAQQLDNLALGNPGRWEQLPTQLQTKANYVRGGQQEACQ